ncbi:tetratricopeptide repeat protein [Alteromonas facilis]|uniref:tetratricopeptide repeat protein n=1 Tax=Alteromonas facilis TaxID=2048004 RepID=UPI000C28CB7F|nr:hypothetical protein [Alteromonas facilis]
MRFHSRYHKGVCVGLLLLLSGCSFYQSEVQLAPANKVVSDDNSRRNALVNLSLDPVTTESSTLDSVPLHQLRDQYQALMPLVEELTQKPNTELAWHGVLGQDIRNRLADIEMLLAEEAQAEGVEVESGDYYRLPILAYETLLAEEDPVLAPLNPLAKENILYQLARAYSLQGNDAQAVVYAERLLDLFPYTNYASELYFRIGEFHYNDNQYAKAIEAYHKVVNANYVSLVAKQRDPFYAMAAYMKGWSHFKLEAYSSAIDAFMLMLEVSLAPENYAQAHKPLDALNLSEQRLVEDALSMTGVMFLAQGGTIAINSYFTLFGEKPFTYLVYDSLAQQLLDDSRYRESAAMYLAFARLYPRHEQAIPSFIKHIDVFILGDFPTDVLPAKQRFVETYGIHGPNWQGFTAQQAEQAMPYLDEFITTLAQHEHAMAQQAAAAINEMEQANETQRTLLARQQKAAYTRSQRWYREYIATFSPSDKARDMQFFLAESLYESGDLLAAIEEYERFAYDYSDHAEAANAAYTALLARGTLAKAGPESENASGTTLSPYQYSQVRFLQTFPADDRANDIAVILMQSLYDDGQYVDAVDWAQWLLARTTSASMQQTAQIVLAQSQFELRDFAAAEGSYQLLLAQLSPADPLHAEMTDKLAATYFQQARQLVAQIPTDASTSVALTPAQANALRASVDKLLRVVDQTPSSSIAINAHFDAISYLMRLSDWSSAIAQILAFQQRYATHALNQEMPERLIIAYENTQQWLKASALLVDVWQQNSDNDKGREALFLAAEYADKANARDIALPHFRTYAHTYPTPLSQANEARFILSNYYLDANEDSKRRFWLNKMIRADAEAGEERSDRSRYLAAMSQSVFAEDSFAAFERIKLTLPLDRSIKRKRDAMQKVIQQYQRVMEYKIAQFTTQAGYRLAQANELLAQSLYDSERPAELDALALEQYDFLLEEQAFPFEEQAINIHSQNAQRSWQGNYDEWVAKSFAALATLLPAQYNKPEQLKEVDYANF